MMKNTKLLSYLFNKFLSVDTKEKLERVILVLAIVSFLIHLLLIYFVNIGVLTVSAEITLFKNPIAAIYTPFSFILIYEVYLLVFYMPKSVTTYVSKQYEIITLIVIRRLFKDFSDLELTKDWLEIKGDLQFTYDILLAILIFFIIYLFKKNIQKQSLSDKDKNLTKLNIEYFINLKKLIAVTLVPVIIILAAYSLFGWLSGINWNDDLNLGSFVKINNIFFEEFFTVLIIVDVLLLLISFFYTDSFHKVIRNSGFIISTILLRLSFSAEGLLNNILILSSIVFGLLILLVHNKYETIKPSEE
ncbi:hypothetical protein FJ651_08925 [Paucihalobacter ruber]|uniref:Uncharacterized protein n=2 Tax=Paucihalobacter ruber TaxID=2567861 RepID=A0A506PIR3_9FLAO|nr:hypothetical protein FJ651_08925 [Paucihalobacter ruber]